MFFKMLSLAILALPKIGRPFRSVSFSIVIAVRSCAVANDTRSAALGAAVRHGHHVRVQDVADRFEVILQVLPADIQQQVANNNDVPPPPPPPPPDCTTTPPPKDGALPDSRSSRTKIGRPFRSVSFSIGSHCSHLRRRKRHQPAALGAAVRHGHHVRVQDVAEPF